MSNQFLWRCIFALNPMVLVCGFAGWLGEDIEGRADNAGWLVWAYALFMVGADIIRALEVLGFM